MNKDKDVYIFVLYKYTNILESPLYWFYNEPFPEGWFWLKEEKKLSEHLEYFQGIESTKEEMMNYLEKKFLYFQEQNKILYFRFI